MCQHLELFPSSQADSAFCLLACRRLKYVVCCTKQHIRWKEEGNKAVEGDNDEYKSIMNRKETPDKGSR